jgi:hypothetical protein
LFQETDLFLLLLGYSYKNNFGDTPLALFFCIAFNLTPVIASAPVPLGGLEAQEGGIISTYT